MTSVGSVRTSTEKKKRVPKNYKPPATEKRSSSSRAKRDQEYDRKLKERTSSREKRPMNEKAAERARKQRAARRAMYIKIGLVAVLVLGFAAGAVALYNSSLFSVEKVIVNGTDRLTKEHIIDIAQVPANATLLRVSTKSISSRVAADPWVESVNVTRSWPNGLKIAITERVPVATVKAGEVGAPWTISSGARWLEAASAEDTAALTAIEGPLTLEPTAGAAEKDKAITNALKLLEDMTPELRDQVALIKTESVEKTELVTKEGISIYIGSADRLAEKEKIALKILADNKGKVIYINVRVPEHPSVRAVGTK